MKGRPTEWPARLPVDHEAKDHLMIPESEQIFRAEYRRELARKRLSIIRAETKRQYRPDVSEYGLTYVNVELS